MRENGKAKPTLEDLLADTKCKHCGESFHSVRVPIIGQEQTQFMNFMGKLVAHLQKKHPEAAAQMFALQAEFSGMLMLNQFTTMDEQLNREQDQKRHKIFLKCQRAFVSDATIKQRVRQLCDESELSELRLVANSPFELSVCALLKEFRDVLGEIGLYPEPSPIITPGPKLPV